MFTYVKLKNFLSFGDVVFDFKKNAHAAKQFVAIYGENGSGKSNFVKSIDLLCQSLISFDNASKFEEIHNLSKDGGSDIPVEVLRSFINTFDIQKYISSCRMVDCTDPTEIEYGFLLNGHEGKYTLSFTDKFTNESLYYFTGKQRGYLYKLSLNDSGQISQSFWSGLFLSASEKKETMNDIEKYWGKHTLLSILVHKMSSRNSSYNTENISTFLLDVIQMFFNTTVITKQSNYQNTGIVNPKPDNMLKHLSSGRISKEQLPQLECSESVLRDFFTQTYADIKDVSYETEYTDTGMVKYQLFVDKMISGKIRHISFKNESAGTQQVLNIVKMLLGLFCGVTVVFDEIDTGVHDVLLNSIVNSLEGEISGQLIITTHNTMLLEEIEPHSAYLIQVDYQGNKSIKCLDEFSLQNTHNARIRYLKGMYGGTPYIDGIDYTSIVDEIERAKEDL